MKLSSHYSSPPAGQSEQHPIYIRISDCRRIYGLTHGVIYRLLAEGEIANFSLRFEGRHRGIRLIERSSLELYLRKRLVTERSVPATVTDDSGESTPAKVSATRSRVVSTNTTASR